MQKQTLKHHFRSDTLCKFISLNVLLNNERINEN